MAKDTERKPTPTRTQTALPPPARHAIGRKSPEQLAAEERLQARGLPTATAYPTTDPEEERIRGNIYEDTGIDIDYVPTKEEDKEFADARENQKFDPHANWGGADAKKLREMREAEALKQASDRKALDDSKKFGRDNFKAIQNQFKSQADALAKYDARQVGAEDVAQGRVTGALNDYAAARGSALRTADDMAAAAANADKTYMTTAEKQFAANADANQRRALAIGSTGGAGGLRTALASSSVANSQASTQAEMVRAQEFNQLQAFKQDALAKAAGVRTGVAQLDQGQQNVYSDAAKAAAANQLGAKDQLGRNTAAEAGAGAAVAGTETDAALKRYGIDVDANTAFETSQQNAGREGAAYLRSQDDKRWWKGT